LKSWLCGEASVRRQQGGQINSPEPPAFAVFGEQFAATDNRGPSANAGAARGSRLPVRSGQRHFLTTTGSAVANYLSRGRKRWPGKELEFRSSTTLFH
jgi:hypothetical protein